MPGTRADPFADVFNLEEHEFLRTACLPSLCLSTLCEGEEIKTTKTNLITDQLFCQATESEVHQQKLSIFPRRFFFSQSLMSVQHPSERWKEIHF